MNKLFWGFLFLFLNIEINLGSVQIGLLPAFVGYALFYSGLSELAGESPRFEKRKPFCIAMAVYTGLLWVLALFGLSVGIPPALEVLLGAVSTIFSYYISFGIVWGVGDIETSNRYTTMNAERLKTTWLVMVVFNALSVLFASLMFVVLAYACLIADVVALVCFLCFFHSSQKAYFYEKERQAHEEWMRKEGNEPHV